MSVFDQLRAFKLAIDSTISDTAAGILTGFTPTATPTNDAPTDAATAGAAIRAAIAGGYTLQVFTSSDASWSVPTDLAAATEAYAGASNGGGKGVTGQASAAPSTMVFGGAPGLDGGYQLEKIDPSSLGSTLNVTVGAAASTDGADGGDTSIVDGATTLVAAVAGEGSIATPQGYVPSNSKPGSGGKGGDAQANSSTSTAGGDGESSATAAGGTGGAATTGNGTGTAGTAGGAGQTGTLPVSGGAGGAGGGGRYRNVVSSTVTGGAGGNGGFPGGASGGGGAASGGSGSTVTGGAAGTPGNGIAFLFWR